MNAEPFSVSEPTGRLGRIAILWRGDEAARRSATPQTSRFKAVFAALDDVGVDAEPVVYEDDVLDAVRAQLATLDGVLVWVNPIYDGRNRANLDALLREVASMLMAASVEYSQISGEFEARSSASRSPGLRCADAASRGKRPPDPETGAVAPTAGGVPAAAGRAEELRIVAPGTAAKDTDTAVGILRPRRTVFGRSLVVFVAAVLNPLQYIAVHVIEAKRVGLLFDRRDVLGCPNCQQYQA